METKFRLSITRQLPAQPEAVFRAWTNGSETIRWVDCPGAEVIADKPDARVGGVWHTEMRDLVSGALFEMNGRYTEVVSNRKLAFTLGSNDAHRDDICSVTFEPHDGGTTMTFTQEPFTDESDRAGYVAGWTTSFDKLATFFDPARAPRSK